MDTLLLKAGRWAHAFLAVGVLGAVVGCGSDDEEKSGSTGGSFESCIASLAPMCKTREITPRKRWKRLQGYGVHADPVDGRQRVRAQDDDGGPYGGKTEWNEGAGTVRESGQPWRADCIPTVIDTFREPQRSRMISRTPETSIPPLHDLPTCLHEGRAKSIPSSLGPTAPAG